MSQIVLAIMNMKQTTLYKGFKARKFFKQQSTVIYFLQGKVLFVHELSHFFVDDKAIEVFINAVNTDEP